MRTMIEYMVVCGSKELDVTQVSITKGMHAHMWYLLLMEYVEVRRNQLNGHVSTWKIDLIQTTAVEERDFGTELSSTPRNEEAFRPGCAKGKVLRRLGWRWFMWSGHPCLRIGTYPEEKHASHIFLTGANWSWAPTSQRCASRRNWKRGELSPQMFAFPRDGSHVLEGTRQVVDLYLKGEEKGFTILSFLK